MSKFPALKISASRRVELFLKKKMAVLRQYNTMPITGQQKVQLSWKTKHFAHLGIQFIYGWTSFLATESLFTLYCTVDENMWSKGFGLLFVYKGIVLFSLAHLNPPSIYWVWFCNSKKSPNQPKCSGPSLSLSTLHIRNFSGSFVLAFVWL